MFDVADEIPANSLKNNNCSGVADEVPGKEHVGNSSGEIQPDPEMANAWDGEL